MEIQKTHTVKDVYSEAMRMMRKEMETFKKRPLTERETEQVEMLARKITSEQLKEMGVV